MHSGGSYLDSINKSMLGAVLSPTERSVLEAKLHEDAKDYYQSALVSFTDALRSVRVGFYSWATVKMYYSIFHSLRCRLALTGDCIYYDGTRPRLISTSASSHVSQPNESSTHKLVIKRFTTLNKFDLFLSQDIDAEKPLEWFTRKRESTNYNQSRFCEPFAPNYLSYAATCDARQMLGSYLADDVYIHSKDHAIVAFPFRLLGDIRLKLAARALQPLSSAEHNFLSKEFCDRSGPITAATYLLI